MEDVFISENYSDNIDITINDKVIKIPSKFAGHNLLIFLDDYIYYIDVLLLKKKFHYEVYDISKEEAFKKYYEARNRKHLKEILGTNNNDLFEKDELITMEDKFIQLCLDTLLRYREYVTNENMLFNYMKDYIFILAYWGDNFINSAKYFNFPIEVKESFIAFKREYPHLNISHLIKKCLLNNINYKVGFFTLNKKDKLVEEFTKMIFMEEYLRGKKIMKYELKPNNNLILD